MDGPDAAIDTPQVCLGIGKRGNRKLVGDLLSSFEVVELDDEVPPGTDICVVDERGFDRTGEELRAWRANERPTYAPVLLLAEAQNNPWRTYNEMIGKRIDGIQPIPAPKQAIRNIVDALLETRMYALLARDRLDQLELYERGMDGATIGMTIADATDPEYPLVYVNDGFLEITGYDRTEVLGRNCRFLQGPETAESTVGEIRRALETESALTTEIRNYRSGGEMFWNELHIEPIRDETGTVTHYLGFQRDVTDRKVRNILLEQYERLVQSVVDPILVLDTESHVLYANDSATSVFDIDETGTDFRGLLGARQTAQLESAMSALEETGEPQSIELVVDTDSTTQSVLQMSVQRAKFDHDTEHERIMLVGRDVTTIREHQNRLSVLDRVLRHNIRNKLTVIVGTTDHLDATLDDLDTAAIREQIDRIENAATDLLDISSAAREFNQTIDPDQADTVETDLVTVATETVADLAEQYPAANLRTAGPEAAHARCPASIRVCIEYLVEQFISTDSDPAVTVAVRSRPETATVELAVTSERSRLSAIEQRVLTRGSEQPLDHAPGIELWLTKWAVLNSGGDLSVTDDGRSVVLTFDAV